MDITLLMTIALLHSVALVSPGPDFAIIVKIATQQARTVALSAAAGISVAILVHSILSLTGVSLLIKSSPLAYIVVQLVGASYLGWMGFGALKSTMSNYISKRQPSSAATELCGADSSSAPLSSQAHSSQAQSSQAHLSQAHSSERIPTNTGKGSASVAYSMNAQQGFIKGLYTNLLNPKALVFFLTLFSALITPEVNGATKIAAAILLLGLSLIWFGFLAIVLSKPGVQQYLQKATALIDCVIGCLFISVAIAIVYGLIVS